MDSLLSPELIHYIERVTVPAVALFTFMFAVPKSAKILRIFSFILLFILFRDAMTPEGLWKITPTLEVRFIEQPVTLWWLAICSVCLVIVSHFAIEDLRD